MFPDTNARGDGERPGHLYTVMFTARELWGEDAASGDKVYLEDAEGREYTYEVFGKLVVEPANLSVLKPIKGKNIVSLQTCTLPDYTNRVIYRAVLKDVKS